MLNDVNQMLTITKLSSSYKFFAKFINVHTRFQKERILTIEPEIAVKIGQKYCVKTV